MAKKKKTRSAKPAGRAKKSAPASRRKSVQRTSKPVAKKKVAKPAKGGRSSKPAAAPSQPPPPPVGSVVWYELNTADPARARTFYAQLFGWRTSEMEMMPGFTYGMFAHKSNAANPFAGIMPIMPEQSEAKPRWDIYVSVKDVDATAAQCEALGGEVIIPPHDIPVGRWAMLKDPTGATLAIYKSKKR